MSTLEQQQGMSALCFQQEWRNEEWIVLFVITIQAAHSSSCLMFSNNNHLLYPSISPLNRPSLTPTTSVCPANLSCCCQADVWQFIITSAVFISVPYPISGLSLALDNFIFCAYVTRIWVFFIRASVNNTHHMESDLFNFDLFAIWPESYRNSCDFYVTLHRHLSQFCTCHFVNAKKEERRWQIWLRLRIDTLVQK